MSKFVDIEENYSYNDITNLNRFVAYKNPFRYRNYYFDYDTGLYYLNSRYYDPETGRFINADDISTLDFTQSTINGLNLYAYCLNNPVNETDENGYFLFWLFFASIIAGAIISAGTSIVSQGISQGWNNINWGQVAWSGLTGAIGGALSASGFGIIGMTISSTLLGFLSSVGSNLIAGNSFSDFSTWLDIGISTVIGALSGRLGGPGATNKGVLDGAVNKSAQFLKAATSYDRVLTKIAEGAYKNLAGAAGARALTLNTLKQVWQSIVTKTIWKIELSSVVQNIIQSMTEIGITFIYYKYFRKV